MMQTRTITVDYARPRGYDVGYRAENNFTELSLPVPAELEGADSYRVYFESTVGEYLQTGLLTPVDGYVAVKITSDVVPEPGNMAAQLVAFADGEKVGYAPMITGTAKVSIPDGTERLSHSLAAEIALNTAARHSHENKAVLDKFAESKDGKPTYDGEALGGGAGDFVIKMTVEVNGDNYTVTSCDKTMEQIDAAVASGQNIKAIAFDKYIMPMIQTAYGESYTFGAFLGSFLVAATVAKNPESGADDWQFYLAPITADIVNYSNAAMPNISTAEEALDELVAKSHSPAYYIDLAGTYPNYTCPVAMDDIKTAYNSGYNLVCRCTLGKFTATLPLFVPMPTANTWIFSGSGALLGMSFAAQSFTVAITSNGVAADQTLLNQPLNITAGDTTYSYDGRYFVDIAVKPATQLITTAEENITLADNTEYRLTDVTTLTLTYPTGNFECWMRLTFAESGTITVTLPAGTGYIGTAPDFKNGETWELSFKDKILAARKVGEGT